MSHTGRTIAKNAGVLMASQVITWGLNLLLTLFLPRYLGATNIGRLHLASSVWAIAAVLVTFGMDTLTIKEVARDPSKALSLFRTTIVLRTILYLLGFAAIVAYVRLLGYATETAYVIYIMGIANLVYQLGDACQSSLKGLEKMEYVSLGAVLSRVTHTALCIALVLLGQGIYAIAAVSTVSSLVGVAIEFSALRRLAPQAPLNLFDWRAALRLLHTSIPYLLSGIFLVIYVQADIVIISLLVDEKTVGWYGAADQLFGTFLFVPTVFMTAVFPALSRLYACASDALPRLMSKSFGLLLVLSVPIGLGLLVIAGPLVVLLFGQEFAPSGPILGIMGIVLIFTYQNMLVGHFLISVDRQNSWTIVMAIATMATVPLDLVLIPWCQQRFGNGGIGGSLSFVVTELSMMAVGLRLMPSGSLKRHDLWLAARVLLAGLVMAALTWIFRSQMLLIPLLVGALSYGGMVMALRLVPREDVILLFELARGLLRQRRAQVVESTGL